MAVEIRDEALDPVDDEHRTQRGEELEGVLRTGDLGVGDRIARHGAQGGDEAAGFLHRGEGVEIARICGPSEISRGDTGGVGNV